MDDEAKRDDGGAAGGDAPETEKPSLVPLSATGETIFTHVRSGAEEGSPSSAPVEAPAPDTRAETRLDEKAARAPDDRRRIGPYAIEAEIGRGGMGVVYRAFHGDLKRTVALKVLIAGEDASDDAIARFHREAEAVARLGHHPNIVPVHDIGTDGRLHYFAMHFVDGKPLDALVDDGEVAPKRAAALAAKVARALAHAHSLGLLHRDVKPANILVTRDGEPQLTDFGLAKDVRSDTRMTRSGATLGTPQYMPPEQAEGNLDAVDARSDVYALGATLFEMLAGRPPFEGEQVVQIIRKMLAFDAPSPRRFNPAVDRDLETICLKCLEKDPDRRYPSAAALADDLERCVAGAPIQARPISRAARVWRRARRNKAAAAALVAAAALLVVLALVTLGPGTLAVASDPPGAAVLLDGDPTGWTTPVEGRLLWPPGSRRVSLVLGGHDPAEATLRVPPLGRVSLSLPLVPDHGFVDLVVEPPDAKASFLLEGRLVDAAAFRVEAPPAGDDARPAPRRYRLPKGAHGIELTAPDHETYRATIFVTPDHVQEVVQNLPRAMGLLSVWSRFKGVAMKATLRGADGKAVKVMHFQVPWDDIPLEAGRWYLEFEKEGYTKFMGFYEIRPGKHIRIHVPMAKKH